ncbi:MAG TPA: metallophosphoesterase family protein [Dehalococcoidia bacterium]|nr:metallophosphoesterase family protein [Dehalococcoidia bacterium]
MKVALYGDIHGYVPGTELLVIDLFRRLVAEVECDLALQVGDMCLYRPLDRPVYMIYGNNDSPRSLADIEAGRRDVPNLHNLKTGEVLTVQAGEERIRLAGLNGGFDPSDYAGQSDPFMPPDLIANFSRADVEKCLGLRDIDIMLVHGTPSGLGFGREPDHAVPALREVMDAVRPRYLFCGHAHFYREVEHEGTRVVSLATVDTEYYTLDTQTGDLARFPVTKEDLRARGWI